MNKKGFINFKLLSIILIIFIICFTLVPKLRNYISTNSKERYITIAKNYIKEVKNSINGLKYKQTPMSSEALLIPVDNIKLSKQTPYGVLIKDYSYVIVVNKDNYYEYYFGGIDNANYGIPIVSEKELNVDSVVYGKSNLNNLNKISDITNLYVGKTLFEESENTKSNDKNILLTPVSGELSVPYEFRTTSHEIYTNIVKNIDTNIYNKEAIISNGVLKYNNKVLNNYSSSYNGVFRYIAFNNNNDKLYYSSFVIYNNAYVAGSINESNDYKNSVILFDSVPNIIINKEAKKVKEKNKEYLMWNLMSIYPNNDNYKIKECGAIILKNKEVEELTFDTLNILQGKSNNNCELGNIFGIRKTNVKKNDTYLVRGYLKYSDKEGNNYISYSQDTIKTVA